jgi:hypothetical protein
MDKDKAFPRIDDHRNQPVPGGIKILHPGKLGDAFQGAIEAITPAVIGAAENRRVAAGLGHDGGGVVAANVEEGSQLILLAPDHDDGFTRHVRRQIVAGLADLTCTPNHLPGAAKNSLALEGGDAVIDIPGRRNGEGFGQRGTVVVGLQKLGD